MLLRKDRRRRYLVDRSFQLNLALSDLWMLLAAGAILALPMVYFFKATSFLLQGHSEELQELIRNQRRVFWITAVLDLVALMAASFLLSIRRSHRVVGPMINLRRRMAELGEGRFDTRVQLRADDALQPLADAFNEMAAKLEARDTSLRGRIQKLEEELAESRRSTPSPDLPTTAGDPLVPTGDTR
jgi:methyl-accepting chemotaxis protein